MIANLITPIAQKDPTLKGISRSRLSLHFNTGRTRRWLLVQLVSAPALRSEDEPEQPSIKPAYRPEHNDYTHLVDNFQVSRLATRLI